MSLPLPTIASRVMTTPGYSFPKTLEKIRAITTQLNAPLRVMESLIQSDPMLTAMILSQAEQANRGRESLRIDEAIKELGLGGIAGLAQGCMLVPEAARSRLAGNWSLAKATGVMAPILARIAQSHLPPDVLTKYDPGTLATCGLLHDLGTPVALLRFPVEYARAEARLEAGDGPFGTLVKQELGAEAGDLGYILARNWSLPKIIQHVIRYHARPISTDEHVELCMVIHLSRFLVRACGFVTGADRFVDSIDLRITGALHLRLEDLAHATREFLEAWEELEAFEPA